MTDFLLTPAEIEILTGKSQHRAQIRVLRGMGIQHKPRPDGSVAVLRAQVELVLGGGGGGRIRRTEPDWTRV